VGLRGTQRVNETPLFSSTTIDLINVLATILSTEYNHGKDKPVLRNTFGHPCFEQPNDFNFTLFLWYPVIILLCRRGKGLSALLPSHRLNHNNVKPCINQIICSIEYYQPQSLILADLLVFAQFSKDSLTLIAAYSYELV
jgi:hypothetical protein